METVKVSPKYQVVIPHTIRKALGIKPGEKVHVLGADHRAAQQLGLYPVDKPSPVVRTEKYDRERLSGLC